MTTEERKAEEAAMKRMDDDIIERKLKLIWR